MSLVTVSHNDNVTIHRTIRNVGAEYQLIITIYAVQVGVTNLLAVAGIAGNTINIIMLRRHGVVNVGTNIMLITLATFDLLYSVTVLLKDIPGYIQFVDLRLSYYIYKAFDPLFVLDHVCLCISITITSAIAIERFVAVFFPFKVASIFTPLRVKFLVTFIVVYIFGLTCPMFVNFNMFGQLIRDSNNTEYLVKHWWISSNIEYYHFMIASQMLGPVNIVIVVICGNITALKLVNTAHRRQRLTNKTSVGDKKAHKMLLLICLACFLFFAPTSAIEIAQKLGFLKNSIYYDAAQSILYGIHSSVNFVIYVVVSRKFYTTYKRIFCRMQKK